MPGFAIAPIYVAHYQPPDFEGGLHFDHVFTIQLFLIYLEASAALPSREQLWFTAMPGPGRLYTQVYLVSFLPGNYWR